MRTPAASKPSPAEIELPSISGTPLVGTDPAANVTVAANTSADDATT